MPDIKRYPNNMWGLAELPPNRQATSGEAPPEYAVISLLMDIRDRLDVMVTPKRSLWSRMWRKIK